MSQLIERYIEEIKVNKEKERNRVLEGKRGCERYHDESQKAQKVNKVSVTKLLIHCCCSATHL